MTQDLKPCPFCGGEAELKQTGQKRLTIKCNNCKISRSQSVNRFSLNWLEEKVINHWNTQYKEKNNG